MVLALAAADAVGVILFGTLYGAAGAKIMSTSAFVGCLLVLFGLVTALWVQTEARHVSLGLVRRVSRALMGLVIVVIGMPALVLMPLFWIDTQLPPDAGLRALLAPAMTILLVALVLVFLVNLVGSLLAAGRTLFRGRRV